jgi:pyruvate/2-oxoglutarate dehydrogenase complex dihydrolipoamide dehydrogenase (E3) component
MFLVTIRFGKDNVVVYHTEFKPLEWCFDLDREDTSYIKVICNKLDNNRVIGFHIVSPNAGEITQGISVAMTCGLTKEQLDNTVGIHPTIAEEVTDCTAIMGEDDGKKEGC